MEVQEVKDRRVLHALDLQLRVRLRVRRDEGRRGNAEHVERELFLLHQLRAGNTHQLDADAHETRIVDVRRDVRAGPGKTDPGAIGVRLGVDTVAKFRGQIVVHDEFAAHDPVGLGISAALESARFPEQTHLCLKARDDRIEELLFIREKLFLGDL